MGSSIYNFFRSKLLIVYFCVDLVFVSWRNGYVELASNIQKKQYKMNADYLRIVINNYYLFLRTLFFFITRKTFACTRFPMVFTWLHYEMLILCVARANSDEYSMVCVGNVLNTHWLLIRYKTQLLAAFQNCPEDLTFFDVSLHFSVK